MWKVVIFLGILSICQGCRVIEEFANGQVTRRESTSSVVLLEVYTGFENKYLCTGTIISPKFILTTASCVFGMSFVNVHVYAHMLRDQFEDKREIHRTDLPVHMNSYNGLDHINDIAIIELINPINMTGKNWIVPAELPTSSLAEGSAGETTGWGLRNLNDDHAASLLQENSLVTISANLCQQAYPRLNWSSTNGRSCIQRSVNLPNCVSDIGSPFTVNNIVYGLQSFGQVEACDSNSPNGITDVFTHISWIRGIISV